MLLLFNYIPFLHKLYVIRCFLTYLKTKYLERKTQHPKKSDSGNPGNQTKRLNSLHDKHVQVSLNNHCHSIVFHLCENTKQFSCSVKAYGPLAHTFLQSRCGQVLVGSFFDFCDNVQGILVLFSCPRLFSSHIVFTLLYRWACQSWKAVSIQWVWMCW
jgi:hypothetical protein